MDAEMVDQLREVVKSAEYAIRHMSGETRHPTDDRPFSYEDFVWWSEHWLVEARAALRDSEQSIVTPRLTGE